MSKKGGDRLEKIWVSEEDDEDLRTFEKAMPTSASRWAQLDAAR